MSTRLVNNFLLDLLVGFGVLVVTTILAVAKHSIGRLDIFVIGVAFFFFLSSLLKARWSDTNPWLQGIAISFGASLPLGLLMLGLGLGNKKAILAFTVLTALACGSGAQAQQFWTRKHLVAAVAVALLFIAVIPRTWQVIIPKLMTPSSGNQALGLQMMNEPANNFILTTQAGKKVSLSSLKGKVVLIDFWGTWCAPCLAEMPILHRVYRRFDSNPDVMFLAVDPGWNGDTEADTIAFAAKKNIDLPLAFDNDQAVKSLKINSLPSLVVIDKQGHIRLQSIGYDEGGHLEDQLTSEIQGLLLRNE